MSEIVLSILIPTLVERRMQWYNLNKRLHALAKDYPVEILSLEDNREKTTGQKRNELTDQAKGRFAAFIDDDDDVPNYYFDLVFKILREKPETDCIGFRGLLIDKTKPVRIGVARSQVFRHSKGLPFSPGLVKGEYLRPPNHLNPMLTEYFRAIRFPDQTFAEDYDFCIRLDKAGLIKHEYFIDGAVMYHYNYTPNKK